MRRRSLGSSEDGDHSPVEAPHVNSHPPPAPVAEAPAVTAIATATATATAASEPRQSPTPSSSQPPSPTQLDRRRSSGQRHSSTRSRRPANANWRPSDSRDGIIENLSSSSHSTSPSLHYLGPPANGANAKEMEKAQESRFVGRRPPLRSPWAITFLTIVASVVGIGFLFAVVNSSATRQLDPKGCRMSYMRPSYARLNDFDTEHTRFASKYSLYLYREQGIMDHDTKVRGIPVLFIPGNAGSYKQVRPIAAEAANYFHDVLQHDEAAVRAGARTLDFFTADFNEDITAFHGQTLLDQAEYLNEAIRYILSLYLDPRASDRDPDLPDPTSVIVLGHSMGGIVARTMLIMPNYQSNSINTILTLSAPHARPPVSFDGQIVKIYQDINDYWRHAYSQQWANNNPLWHVTLVSIAGGGLDTVVPSDYASVESLVPDTHGFTVFTSTVPTVWTSMDHHAILWCDQFRKVVARAIYDVVDVNRATQTKPRAERMRVFKKWFLTGMEAVAERTAPLKEPSTLLTLEDSPGSIIAEGERLVLRRLGANGTARAHLMPIPPAGSPSVRFTLLTDQKLDSAAENGKLEVLFCSIFPLQPGAAGAGFAAHMDLSGEGTESTRFACINAVSDVVVLPASSPSTRHPFTVDGEREISPFSYLQYELEDISEHQFVAVVEKATSPTAGFVVAEFSDHSQSHRTRHISIRRLLAFGMKLRLPSERPMVTEIKIPSVQSSLLAYNLEVGSQACTNEAELFSPLVRQYLAEPYESKFFVNARQVTVSLHGVAPYVPPSIRRRSAENGLSFQFWTDPTCASNIQVSLTVDVMGSFGKLYMRYRTVFAAFPLFVVALVLRKQFRIYDASGIFISFSESLDLCLRQSIPLMLVSLTFLSLSSGSPSQSGNASFWHWRNSTSSAVDFQQNDLLIGTQDYVFWFLIPLIGIVCVGVCVLLNYATLALTYILSTALNLLSFRPGWIRNEERRRPSASSFLSSSPRRRMITTAVLLFLVSTFIPYQFAYLVACLVQLTTTVRAQRIASELRSGANSNFYNYVHSILVLMLWVLPINLPILVVWIHNLAVHWLTPFSSHHNVLSIMPFIMLVETLTTGKMIPRVTSRFRYFTSVLFFGISVYAAVYGVSYAYMLHYLVNLVAAWLTIVHLTSDSWSLSTLNHLYEGNPDDRKRGKEP